MSVPALPRGSSILLSLAACGCSTGAPPMDKSDTPTAASTPSAIPGPAEEASRFVRLRPDVLGFAVESDAACGRCRLVAVDGDSEPLVEGSLEECEARLAALLVERHGRGNPNLPFATLGGKQFWGDVFVLGGWRIQENALTGHFRLLDADDVRRAWGTYESCRAAFEEARIQRRLRPRSESVVVLLHGLGRSKGSFHALRVALERDGYEVVDINYPSTRRSVREHAEAIAVVLSRLEGARSVSFVTHSLGGIVARELLSLDRPWRASVKVERLVMLAPPSRGSAIAEALKDWLPYQLATGDVGQELTPGGAARLPLPPCEFGIIAGSWGEAKGLNPFLEGDHDGVVTVEEARLPGAADFLVVKSSHTFIMQNESCLEATLRFLHTGKFQPAPDGVGL